MTITMAEKPMSNDCGGEKGEPPASLRYQRRNVKHVPTHEKFHDRCDDLKGQIYDCSDVQQADQFTKATDEIVLHIGRNCKSPGDIKSAILNLQKREIPLPWFEPRDLQLTASPTVSIDCYDIIAVGAVKGHPDTFL
jgi:hypothetical protein